MVWVQDEYNGYNCIVEGAYKEVINVCLKRNKQV